MLIFVQVKAKGGSIKIRPIIAARSLSFSGRTTKIGKETCVPPLPLFFFFGSQFVASTGRYMVGFTSLTVGPIYASKQHDYSGYPGKIETHWKLNHMRPAKKLFQTCSDLEERNDR